MENFISCPEGNNSITFVVTEQEIEYLLNCVNRGLRDGDNRVAETFSHALNSAFIEFNRLREQRLEVPADPNIVNSGPPYNNFEEAFEEDEEYYGDEEDEPEY